MITKNEIRPAQQTSFEEWLKQLDKWFNSTVGLDHTDVEDYDWYSAWTSEVTPESAFQEWYDVNWSEFL